MKVKRYAKMSGLTGQGMQTDKLDEAQVALNELSSRRVMGKLINIP
jgi:hypothetical protein